MNKNENDIYKIYLVIPTINGLIDGKAFITLSLDFDYFDVVIYEINLLTLEVIEYDG